MAVSDIITSTDTPVPQQTHSPPESPVDDVDLHDPVPTSPRDPKGSEVSVAASELDSDDDAINPSTGEGEKEGSEEDSFEVRRSKLPLKVDVEWLDFEHFKNRYSPEDGLAIMEVLQGHPHLFREVSREMRMRIRQNLNARPLTKPIMDANSPTWMQRIRIQSPQLLSLLSRLTGHEDKWPTNKPRTFFQPFRMFYYMLPQVKECARLLEKTFGDQKGPGNSQDEAGSESKIIPLPPDDADESGDENDGASKTGGVFTQRMKPAHAISTEPVFSATSLSHIRKYIEFVEEHIVPHWEKAMGDTKRKVRYDDLWMSFKEGELLYMPPVLESSRNHATAKEAGIHKMYQRAWRLYGADYETLDDDNPDDIQAIPTEHNLEIEAYYIDYDGSSFVPVRHTFKIERYAGEKDITSLPIYPMRFVKDVEKVKTSFHEQGRRFQEAVKEKHMYYDGWTLTHGPTGLSADPEPTAVEHIEGEVIIDFVEGFKSEPSLGPGPGSWDKGLVEYNDSEWSVGDDQMAIRHWETLSDGESQIVSEIIEKTQRAEWFGVALKANHLKTRRLPREYEEGRIVTEVDDDDVAILPRRVVAYAFRERKFVMLDTHFLKPVPATTQDVFRDLKINPEHKRMVRSLVQSHIEKQRVQKQRPTLNLNQDLIRGKGAGLVVLLHGVPGVGKTCTAEAVAQANKKPLFVITCGDLGFTPKEVETALRDIFRLAHMWGCVLLLDEADIFLSRREASDLKRNALVSVFLRVLEQYSGILFLTTNRVGTIDEAFKSRIHISLYYPPLSREQTLAIFEVNLRKLHEIEKAKHSLPLEGGPDAPRKPALIIDDASIMDYAEWHYNEHEDSPQLRWNGRQIRNSFQIAHSLAHFGMQNATLDQWGDEIIDDEATNAAAGGSTGQQPEAEAPRLDWVQFDQVANAIENFEDYLYEATARTDKDRAQTAQLRADDYDAHHRHRSSGYHPSRPQNQSRSGYGQPSHSQRGQYQPPRGDYQPPMRGYPGPQQSRQTLGVHSHPAGPGPRPRDMGTPARGREDSGYSGWGTGPHTPEPRPSSRQPGQIGGSPYSSEARADEGYQDLGYGAPQQPYYGEAEPPHPSGRYGRYEPPAGPGGSNYN
ncbi:uncharacterized protein DNG_07446 [Cephalotrichum gorgonifer]|uniref:AAA+ ATPase domain-containing protein n=1 Tax=Cephalotrichum gorgonifer TaxID=2041049 RepID=A0AAE8N1K8_9PEZI|nr:uncharacterized protein DNG_07446 [Cephalotrichum gorgonifer]